MGPRHTIHDHRGYLAETAFDAARGTFVERPLPAPPATPQQASPSDAMKTVLTAVEQRMRDAHADHLGYPYNLTGRASTPASLGDYLINNLGDPYAGSHYGSEVCDLEREAVDWLMRLWECDTPEDHWGSVVASGTEGNIWALYLAREALPEAVLIHGAEAHYSIPKAARILRMRAISVPCDAEGAIRLDALSATLSGLDRNKGVVLALTCGTTVKGAHDDIGGAMERLDAAGFDAGRRFVHVDGALNAMVLPFLDGVPSGLRPSFRHGIDSLSTSGHKMIGTPMPCGVLIARRPHVTRVARAIAYLRSDDTTLMGSRNGHAVLAVWTRLMGHGTEGFRRDAESCRQRAADLARDLRTHGVPVLLNPFSLTVLFPEPDPTTVKRFQLSCSGGQAHAIVMPNVSDDQLRRFRDAYLAWWETDAGSRVIPGNYPISGETASAPPPVPA
jgi:histidine decarboxylase